MRYSIYWNVKNLVKNIFYWGIRNGPIGNSTQISTTFHSATIGPQNVPRTFATSIFRAFPTDLILTISGTPWSDVLGTPWNDFHKTSYSDVQDVAGMLIRNVPRTFSVRPLEGIQSMSEGRCGVISSMSQNFFLLFFRNFFDWSNPAKSDSTLRVYCKPSWTSNMERFLRN